MEASTSTFRTYSIDKPLVAEVSDVNGSYRSVNGKKRELPLVIYLGGATGAAKTVLGTLFSKEEGIGYDAIEVSKEAGIELTLDDLASSLNIQPNQRVFIHLIPKATTRKPRNTEIDGLDFYFLTPREFKERCSEFLFTYGYPAENPNRYGMPKSIAWPLNFGIDSVVTVTGYEAFSRMGEKFPKAAGIMLYADPRDIEGHIKGRAASESEVRSRLSSYARDLQDFNENRHSVSYSVSIASLKSFRTDITTERERMILQELNDPLRQIRAIVKWERYLQSQSFPRNTPQDSFNYFIDEVISRVFPGVPYQELKGRVDRGERIKLIDKTKDADSDLLQKFSEEKDISRTLLEEIVDQVHITATIDANGRRTIVLSPYDEEFIASLGGTGKKAIVELLDKKINGVGVHYLHGDRIAQYNQQSYLSLLGFGMGVEEGVYVYLTSDHIPAHELTKPRAVNFVFSGTSDPAAAKESIRPLTLDELLGMQHQMAHDDVGRAIFQQSIRKV